MNKCTTAAAVKQYRRAGWMLQEQCARKARKGKDLHMIKRLGRGVLAFDNPPTLRESAAIVGSKEGEGPLGNSFDEVWDDAKLGEDTWEKAESALQNSAMACLLKKAKIEKTELDALFAGDLLNQLVGSHYGLRDYDIPLVGLYGACSTMAQSLAMAGLFISSGGGASAVAITSSHFCASERQFRMPLAYGNQRTPSIGEGPFLRGIAIGRIQDKGITDVNNMGAAMAPAAAETIQDYLIHTVTAPEDYDLILTGDLGHVGSDLLLDLLAREGYEIGKQHQDCGLMIYDLANQNVASGGSGCGCSAVVLCSSILPQIRSKQLNNVLFVGTGALMSPTTTFQGESIPSIAHLVHISTSRT